MIIVTAIYRVTKIYQLGSDSYFMEVKSTDGHAMTFPITEAQCREVSVGDGWIGEFKKIHQP